MVSCLFIWTLPTESDHFIAAWYHCCHIARLCHITTKIRKPDGPYRSSSTSITAFSLFSFPCYTTYDSTRLDSTDTTTNAFAQRASLRLPLSALALSWFIHCQRDLFGRHLDSQHSGSSFLEATSLVGRRRDFLNRTLGLPALTYIITIPQLYGQISI